jgi:hypothetical protein
MSQASHGGLQAGVLGVGSFAVCPDHVSFVFRWVYQKRGMACNQSPSDAQTVEP